LNTKKTRFHIFRGIFLFLRKVLKEEKAGVGKVKYIQRRKEKQISFCEIFLIPDVTYFFGYPPRMMIGFLTSLCFLVTPSIMMIGFLTSLSFWVTRQE
jgi:hypothetical protein